MTPRSLLLFIFYSLSTSMIQSGFIKLEEMEGPFVSNCSTLARSWSAKQSGPNKPSYVIRQCLLLRQSPSVPPTPPHPGKDIHIAEWLPSDGHMPMVSTAVVTLVWEIGLTIPHLTEEKCFREKSQAYRRTFGCLLDQPSWICHQIILEILWHSLLTGWCQASYLKMLPLYWIR